MDIQSVLDRKDELFDNVQRGAKFLDGHTPDWFIKIDISALEINNPTTCVCGQVFMDKVLEHRLPSTYDGYDWAIRSLEIDSMTDYGFNAISMGWEYGYLGELWAFEIEKRLADAGLMGDRHV